MELNKGISPKFVTCSCLGLLLSALPGVAFSQAAFFDPEEGVNIAAIGVAGVPDYIGSDDQEAVPAIIARYYFSSGKRYVQLLGPQLSLNLLNHDVFQLGPQILYRKKRDDDVEDDVVKRMRTIDSTTEGGIFAAAVWRLEGDNRHRFSVRADWQTSNKGGEGTFTVNYYRPLSQKIVMNVGGGLGFSNDKWARTYFGVEDTDVALFPSLGGQPYQPKGGLNDYRVNFGVIAHLKPQWHLFAGARYLRLRSDVADSPIVSERGDKNQWVYGAAIGYAWQ